MALNRGGWLTENGWDGRRVWRWRLRGLLQEGSDQLILRQKGLSERLVVLYYTGIDESELFGLFDEVWDM